MAKSNIVKNYDNSTVEFKDSEITFDLSLITDDRLNKMAQIDGHCLRLDRVVAGMLKKDYSDKERADKRQELFDVLVSGQRNIKKSATKAVGFSIRHILNEAISIGLTFTQAFRFVHEKCSEADAKSVWDSLKAE